MTSNPAMFEKALAEDAAYNDQIRIDAGEHTASELFERIAAADVRDACDVFRPIYDQTAGADGHVSIEVSPTLAYKLRATVADASRLWATVDRPNLMIKVPGTSQGASAVRELTAAGISVNITLLFSLDMHHAMIDAYMAGLEERTAAGKQLGGIRSVASFFLSRIDVEVDEHLERAARTAAAQRDVLQSLGGKAAIANAKLAYRQFQHEFSSPRWTALASRGGNVQRLLWASTGVKKPVYRDVMYVESLIGPDSIVTMPQAVIDAFRDHGVVERTVDANVEKAEEVLHDLARNGISMRAVTDKLLADGIASFEQSAEAGLKSLEQKATDLGKHLVASP
jgi:transaldolase